MVQPAILRNLKRAWCKKHIIEDFISGSSETLSLTLIVQIHDQSSHWSFHYERKPLINKISLQPGVSTNIGYQSFLAPNLRFTSSVPVSIKIE